METGKKFSLLIVAIIGMLCFYTTVNAAGPTRGAKGSAAINYTVNAASITTNGGPVVIYSVIMSSAAVNDFIALFDSATAVGITASVQTSVLKTRCYASNSSGTTTCNYDPPLQFNLGAIAAASSAADQALIVFERGRVNQGY